MKILLNKQSSRLLQHITYRDIIYKITFSQNINYWVLEEWLKRNEQDVWKLFDFHLNGVILYSKFDIGDFYITTNNDDFFTTELMTIVNLRAQHNAKA